MDLIMQGWDPTPVSDYAEASRIYCERRDESGMGASGFGDGRIVAPTGAHVARISYNGRVWPPGKWKTGDRPLWDNRDPDAMPAAFPGPAHPASGLTMAQRDALADMHHDVSRARRALADAGVELSQDEAAGVLAAARGHSDPSAHRSAAIKGARASWTHDGARRALIAHGVDRADARTVADAMARAVDRQIVTLTEVSDMIAAAPGVAAVPLPTGRLDREGRASCEESGLATIGDLASRGDGVPGDVLDAVLGLLTHQRKNGD